MKGLFFGLALATILLLGCRKDPVKLKLSTIDALVLEKENCNLDPTHDYWILDLSSNKGHSLGDTLQIDGTTYNHVVKAILIKSEEKRKGVRLRIKYESLSQKRVTVSNCFVTDSLQYTLYEINISDTELL